MSPFRERALQPPAHGSSCRCLDCVAERDEATADARYERAYWQDQERAS